jgi:heme oxygenase (mycobilin-producing)
MNVYLTAGTFDFLKKMEAKYPNERMVTMVNENSAVLFHETTGKTVFQSPRSYEAISSIGEIKKQGTVAMNNIPVTDEARPLFEHQLKDQLLSVSQQQGFLALRFLRPQKSNTFVILTVWESAAYHQQWHNSKSFDLQKLPGMDSQSAIFASTPYVSKYTITE